MGYEREMDPADYVEMPKAEQWEHVSDGRYRRVVSQAHRVPRSPAPEGYHRVKALSPTGYEAMQAVLRAWTMEGDYPKYHAAMQAELRRRWPTLGNALDALAKEKRS